MVHDEKSLDQITGKILKQSGIGEPSVQFTDRVMESILAAQVPVERTVVRKLQYLWLVLILPVIAALVWYLSSHAVAFKKVMLYVEPLSILFNAVTSAFAGFFSMIGTISISPFILKAGLAISFLLVIESFYTIRKSLH